MKIFVRTYTLGRDTSISSRDVKSPWGWFFTIFSLVSVYAPRVGVITFNALAGLRCRNTFSLRYAISTFL